MPCISPPVFFPAPGPYESMLLLLLAGEPGCGTADGQLQTRSPRCRTGGALRRDRRGRQFSDWTNLTAGGQTAQGGTVVMNCCLPKTCIIVSTVQVLSCPKRIARSSKVQHASKLLCILSAMPPDFSKAIPAPPEPVPATPSTRPADPG